MKQQAALSFFLFTLCSVNLFGQDSTLLNKGTLSVSGVVDVYYAYNFNNPASNSMPNFIYNSTVNNRLSLNLALLRFNHHNSYVRTNIGLMSGTYAQANLASEPTLFQFIYEANTGFKISKKKNIWIDAGILNSHIGWESAIQKDCWTLSRSIAAENSPYYETGVRGTFISKNEKWTIALLYLNGWQHIQRPAFNTTPAGGWHVLYKPNNKLTLNSSSFVGNDKPDSVKQMRYFHDFYAVFKPNKKLGFILGFDYGIQQRVAPDKKFDVWYSPVLISRYFISKKISVAARVEKFVDQTNIIVSHICTHGKGVSGYSVNFDYHFNQNAMFRMEGKVYHHKDGAFETSYSYLSPQMGLFFVSLISSF